MRRWRAVGLALVLASGFAWRAAAQPGSDQRAQGLDALARGDARSAIGSFEEALVDRLDAGDPAGVAESLGDLGRLHGHGLGRAELLPVPHADLQ